jgi:hypothetical protein
MIKKAFNLLKKDKGKRTDSQQSDAGTSAKVG